MLLVINTFDCLWSPLVLSWLIKKRSFIFIIDEFCKTFVSLHGIPKLISDPQKEKLLVWGSSPHQDAVLLRHNFNFRIQTFCSTKHKWIVCNQYKNSNHHYIRVSRCHAEAYNEWGVHLRLVAHGQHSSEKTSWLWLAVDHNVSDLT